MDRFKDETPSNKMQQRKAAEVVLREMRNETVKTDSWKRVGMAVEGQR